MLNNNPYLKSRIHPLKNFCHRDANVYIKRDDELSCGISGSKKRKYASIIPALIQQEIQHVYLIGSAHSNNVLSALQCCKEHNLQVTALLLKPHAKVIDGNFKLSHLFLEKKDIIWVDRKNWPEINATAQFLAIKNPKKSFILTEGSSVVEGVEGAKTLGLDILRNEKEYEIQFDHIFIDAGTGFSASCCIKLLEEHEHPATVHVLLLANTEEDFLKTNISLANASYKNTRFFTPSTAKSFGSVNQTIKSYIRYVASEYGILVDPIYSAKCLYESQKKINDLFLTGNILIIHSGGTLSLPNFSLY
jgi:1-aminocyclopropane-1-carboxylate deaminase/D-cysteine desulfhydrase-like pyridoxal-dependent ACC family enzyme